MNDYTQNVKNIARSELIQNAIKILTSERHNSTIATRNYVREVKSCLLNRDHSKDVEYAQKLSDGSIKKWEYMYDSIIEKKSANQLKIAYLCGPQPENDLEEFLKQGILPENIWAFENGNKEFSCAIKNICAVNYPFVKVINANIADFCSQSSIRFDFIYLDFCGSIASKESKTVKTLTKIIQSHSLNNFGILATNFSLQTYEQDEKNSENLDRLMSTYLYPKTFLGNIENNSYNTIEGPTSHYTDIDEWMAIVQKDRDFYYGEFVSLFLIDLFQIITPYGYFLKNKTLFDTLFKIQNKDKFIEKLNIFLGKSEYKCGCECKCECQSEYEEYEECKHNYDCECRYDCECECGCKLPEIMTEPYANSILWALVVLSDKKIMESFGINTKGFDKYCESFISQISGNIDDSKKYLENIFSVLFLLQEENSINNYYGEKLNSLKGVHNFNNFYQFCDLFLFHQIKELLVRQLSVPYHINIEKSERWQYRAKETDMFMDMFVLDECRYLYDWMPSIGTIDKCLDDLERQFVFRFVLDAISKHRQHYCTELFFGTAVTSAHEKGFGLKELKQRKPIKE